MLSGGKAGLVSSDVLRKEKEEARRRDGNNKDLESQYYLLVVSYGKKTAMLMT